MKANTLKVIAIVGPTGVGKSEYALPLARELPSEIISCDSMQVYRYMDIGTAKPTKEQQQFVRHHLIDLVNPDEPYHAELYRQQAWKSAEELINKNQIPLMVGGTGLYLKAFLQGLFAHPEIPSEIREKVTEDWKDYPSREIHQQLEKVDKISAAKIHPHDRKRILRALEIYEYLHLPMSELQNRQADPSRKMECLMIGLNRSREDLYQRINRRVEEMLDQGWIREVASLRNRGYSPTLRSMQGLGYKRINDYLDGQLKKEEILSLIQQDTRRYAKRQLTWFRADKNIRWLNLQENTLAENKQAISKAVREFQQN